MHNECDSDAKSGAILKWEWSERWNYNDGNLFKIVDVKWLMCCKVFGAIKTHWEVSNEMSFTNKLFLIRSNRNFCEMMMMTIRMRTAYTMSIHRQLTQRHIHTAQHIYYCNIQNCSECFNFLIENSMCCACKQNITYIWDRLRNRKTFQHSVGTDVNMHEHSNFAICDTSKSTIGNYWIVGYYWLLPEKKVVRRHTQGNVSQLKSDRTEF